MEYIFFIFNLNRGDTLVPSLHSTCYGIYNMLANNCLLLAQWVPINSATAGVINITQHFQRQEFRGADLLVKPALWNVEAGTRT